ncbi:MAG: alpha/beta fold hydrolase [Gammaproteobacteria bacterium]
MNRPVSSSAVARPWLAPVGALVMLAGGLLAFLVQTAGGVRVLDVRFAGTGGIAMSALLFIPPNATPKTPAPGVLAVHGYFNSRETQGNFAIEFARRGYVVLALDQAGHGYSDPPAFAHGFGGPDGLRYLRSLDFVDQDNIGLEGHSMGGWAVVNAASAFPNGYKALVLEGSSTGPPFAQEGTPQFPRNLAVVYARYDEFSPVMWGVPTARGVTDSPKLWKQFGTQGAVEPGKLYGSIADGTARILYTPGGTHPWNHLSKAAIGSAVEWFQRTLSGGTPKPPQDQVWYWKELGTAVAFVGFVVLLLGLFDVLLGLPYFAPLVALPVAAAVARSPRWWVALVVGALLPAVTLFPFFQLGSLVLPASKVFPQAVTNEIVVWALLNAVLVAALSLLPGGARAQFNRGGVRAFFLAALTMAVGYSAVVLLYAFFTVDLRYWFVALKPMAARQLPAFAAYLIPFTVFFLVTLRAMHATLNVAAHSARAQYFVNIVALTAGFVVLLAIQYGVLFSTGRIVGFFMSDALRTIIAINFVPLMIVIASVSTFAYRRTASYVPGALVCAALVAWYVVVGQATQAGG